MKLQGAKRRESSRILFYTFFISFVIVSYPILIPILTANNRQLEFTRDYIIHFIKIKEARSHNLNILIQVRLLKSLNGPVNTDQLIERQKHIFALQARIFDLYSVVETKYGVKMLGDACKNIDSSILTIGDCYSILRIENPSVRLVKPSSSSLEKFFSKKN